MRFILILFTALFLSSCNFLKLSVVASGLKDPPKKTDDSSSLKYYEAVDITGGVNRTETSTSFISESSENIALIGSTVCSIVNIAGNRKILCRKENGDQSLLSDNQAHTLISSGSNLYFCGAGGVRKYNGIGTESVLLTSVECQGSLTTQLVELNNHIYYSGNDGTFAGIFHFDGTTTTSVTNFDIPQMETNNATVISFNNEIFLWLKSSNSFYKYNPSTKIANFVYQGLQDLRIAGDLLYILATDSISGLPKYFSYNGTGVPVLISGDYKMQKFLSKSSPLLFVAKDSNNDIHLFTHDSTRGLRIVADTGSSPWGIIVDYNSCLTQIGTKTFFLGPSGTGLFTDRLYSFDSSNDELVPYPAINERIYCIPRESSLILKSHNSTSLVEFIPSSNQVIPIENSLSTGMIKMASYGDRSYYYSNASELMKWDGVTSELAYTSESILIFGDDKPRLLTPKGSDLFFVADDSFEGELYRYDGNNLSKAAEIVSDGNDNIVRVGLAGDELYFVNRDSKKKTYSLYKYNSDLDSAKVSDIYLPNIKGKVGVVEFLAKLDGGLYFLKTAGKGIQQLFKYDGGVVDAVAGCPKNVFEIKKWENKLILVGDDDNDLRKVYTFSETDGFSLIDGDYINPVIIETGPDHFYFDGEDVNDSKIKAFIYATDPKDGLMLASQVSEIDDVSLRALTVIEGGKLVFAWNDAEIMFYSPEGGLQKYERITDVESFEITDLIFKDGVLYYSIYAKALGGYVLYRYDLLLGGIEIARRTEGFGPLSLIDSILYGLDSEPFQFDGKKWGPFVDIHPYVSDDITYITKAGEKLYVIAAESDSGNGHTRVFKLNEKK